MRSSAGPTTLRRGSILGAMENLILMVRLSVMMTIMAGCENTGRFAGTSDVPQIMSGTIKDARPRLAVLHV